MAVMCTTTSAVTPVLLTVIVTCFVTSVDVSTLKLSSFCTETETSVPWTTCAQTRFSAWLAVLPLPGAASALATIWKQKSPGGQLMEYVTTTLPSAPEMVAVEVCCPAMMLGNGSFGLVKCGLQTAGPMMDMWRVVGPGTLTVMLWKDSVPLATMSPGGLLSPNCSSFVNVTCGPWQLTVSETTFVAAVGPTMNRVRVSRIAALITWTPGVLHWRRSWTTVVQDELSGQVLGGSAPR